MGRVLEQAVEWVEHLVGEGEEEFSVGMLGGPSFRCGLCTEATHLETPP